MHGDFSRGTRPDAKRGERYLRGFAQQRRLLLDSDLNSFTDALHERLRGLASHLGCPKGSPDLGFLVTPGRLLALFHDLDGVLTGSSSVTVHREYGSKYLDRFPSLHLAADQGAAGSVTLALRAPADGSTVFWCRAEASTTVTLTGGVALVVPAASEFQAVTVSFAAPVQALQIDLDAGEEIWIVMIEQRQTATLAPRFDFAAGHYYLNGLPLQAAADTTWTANGIPPAANLQVSSPPRNLVASDRLLAYLEGWEQHITATEDPGIRENALGGDSDTTTRGRAIGQVKLAWVPPGFDQDALARALEAPVLGSGTLNVTTPPADPDPDPCALPVQGGYTGRDNRLYRFEAHEGGPLGTALLKWSRDNGAELFPVVTATDQALTFPANTSLQPGDLVEVLTAETVELGDASPAVLDAAGTFTPSVRAVGRLARLQAATSAGTGVTYTLREPDGVGVVTLPAHFGPFPAAALKVRRWHGLLQTTAAPSPNVHAVENGIEVELAGSYLPGDFWQYEARVSADNVNGPFQVTPHGPERGFAPLALLRFTAANQPLVLERWLDDRFPPICELTADDIAFDGGHIGSESDTVQEVIEELWERIRGGCCEATLTPSSGDAAAAIRQVLLETDDEITICLEPGIYRFESTVEVSGRKVVVRGCPRAVLVGAAALPLFQVQAGGRLELEQLSLFGRNVDGVRILVDVASLAESVEAREVGFFVVPNPAAPTTVTLAIRVDGQEPSPINPSAPVPQTAGTTSVTGPAIRLDRCLAAASWALSSTALSALEIEESLFHCATGCLWLERVADVELRGTDLLAGISLSALQAWTPEALLANGDALAEQLGGLALPDPASLGVRVRNLVRGRLAACRFRAGFGFAASLGQSLVLEGNTHTVSRTGVYLWSADEARLDGERILAAGTASAPGVQLGRGGRCTLVDSRVTGFPVGVALGAENAGSAPRLFMDVRVEQCEIEDVDVGIQLGLANLNPSVGELRHVALAGNSITAQVIGILVNALLASNNRPGHVRVSGNVISARMGVGVAGHHVEVSDNRIHLVNGTGTRFGVLASGAGHLVCEANQVELRLPTGLPTNPFAGPTPSTSLAAAGQLGIYVAAGAKVSSAAFQLLNGADARVAENTAHSEGSLLLPGLLVSNHPRLASKGNEFLSGPVACENVDDLVFSGNTVSGNVEITGSTSGLVSDNRVRRREGSNFDGRLTVTTAEGEWKVVDNRVDGALAVRPRLRIRFPFDWSDIIVNPVGTYFPGSLGPLAAIGALADDPRFYEIVFPPQGPGGLATGSAATSPGTGSMFMMAGPSPMEAALSTGDPEWVAKYSAGVADFAIGGMREEIKGLEDLVFVPILSSTEASYQVQCAHNSARDIEIGHTGTQIISSALSIVQVIGNRAAEEISVRSYQRLVMALNAAENYPLAGGSSTAAIASPNLLT